jgi:hyperosmotically inducible periplasmic protein
LQKFKRERKNNMKRNLQIIVTASAASVLAFSALAQDTSNSKMDESQSPRQHMTQSGNDQLKDTAKASDIVGMTVKNNQDEKLGKVENLAVDVESGRIVQVIISSGGFLGMDKTLTPVPPGALHHDMGEKVLRLDASMEKFKAAPKCDTAKWDEDTQSNRVSEVYSYYGQQPYFVQNGYGTANMSAVSANSLPRNMDGTINTAAPRPADTAHNVEVARSVEENNNNISTRNPDGTWRRTYYSNGTEANSAWPNLGYVQKTSKLMGTTVNNLQDEKIGTIKDFIVDLSAGRVVAVILSTGGYLGMNGELSAVPASALKSNREHNALQLDISKQTLANSPHFKSNEWPDFNQPGYAGGVYRAYQVEPYFASDAATTRRNVSDRVSRTETENNRDNPQAVANTDADNTARNVRDRNSSTQTPLDQGNNQADINTTAQIRKEVIATDGMSTNAKNVKIITLNGHVTLRGPVNTADEKRQIGDIANRIAQSSNVDNQLEVSQITTSLN